MLIIRKEQRSDYQHIELITQQAFVAHPNRSGKEATMPQKLRESTFFCFALVAEYKQQVVAHISLSNVQFNDEKKNIFSISSLAVLPEFQGKGIGTKLVKIALSKLAKKKAQCCVLVGDPNFYSRLGFKVESQQALRGDPKICFQSFDFNPQ